MKSAPELGMEKVGELEVVRWQLYIAPRNSIAIIAPQAMKDGAYSIFARTKKHAKLGDVVVELVIPIFSREQLSPNEEEASTRGLVSQ